MKKIVHHSILVCLLCLAQLSCAQQNINEKNADTIPLESENIDLKGIESLVDFAIESDIDTECDDVSQCRTIGFSPSPCGGFSTYLVYSSKKTNVDKLTSKVKVMNQERSKKIKDKGLVGICQFIAKPKLICSANRCVANSNNKAAIQ